MEPLREGTPGALPELELGQELDLEGFDALENAAPRLAEAPAWRKLLDRHVPAGEPVAVLADPASLYMEDLGRRVVGFFAETPGSAGGVARLEAHRARGVRFVLVPAAWGEQDAYLAEHLRARFQVIAEDPEAGAILEPSAHTAGDVEASALEELIDSVSEDRRAPMLDWTSLGMAGLLPGRTLFRPVEPDAGTLPYLDHTIDVVLTDDAARMDEAARVAGGAAVLVTIDEVGGAIVVETRPVHSKRRAAAAPILVLVATEADDEWLGRVAEAVSGRPGVDVAAAVNPLAALVATDAPTLVLAERGVLPLPGCIEAAESLLATDPQVGAVAVKLFDADGSLEAAGGAAFADGSVEGIARGAPAAAPWHGYVRPVAAAVGLVVLRSAAARQCCGDGVGALDLTALSAGLWSSGWELRYQPDAAAVRALPPAGAATTVWPQLVDGLPARPAELDHASWRRLLARAEVGAVR